MTGTGGVGPVRLVATDLDGTVVTYAGEMSDRMSRALQAVTEAGLDLVIATGRPPRWMAPVVEATGHRGVALCANGALRYDLKTEQVLAADILTPDTVAAIIATVRSIFPRATFATETTSGFIRTPDYVARWDAGLGRQVVDLPAVLDDQTGCVKLLVRDEESTSDAMLAAVAPAVGARAEVTHSNPRDCLLEISAAGVSKGAALARLCAERGIAAHEVVAFGDQPNDISMLEWAGTSYAVASGHPDALAAADHVTESVTEDGVARIIEELLAGRTG